MHWDPGPRLYSNQKYHKNKKFRHVAKLFYNMPIKCTVFYKTKSEYHICLHCLMKRFVRINLRLIPKKSTLCSLTHKLLFSALQNDNTTICWSQGDQNSHNKNWNFPIINRVWIWIHHKICKKLQMKLLTDSQIVALWFKFLLSEFFLREIQKLSSQLLNFILIFLPNFIHLYVCIQGFCLQIVNFIEFICEWERPKNASCVGTLDCRGNPLEKVVFCPTIPTFLD